MTDVEDEAALLSAMNNIMLQSVFLTAENLRIYNQVLNETITEEEGQDLFEQCKEVAEEGEALVHDVLEGVEGGDHDETVELMRDLLDRREDFEVKAEKAEERIVERGEDSQMFY